jgi:hypothetical protein
MGYDGTMSVERTVAYWTAEALILAGVVWVTTGCGRDRIELEIVPEVTPDFDNTADPALAQTLQADARITAQWVATLPAVPTATHAPLPTYDPAEVVGTPAAQRTGPCSAPEDFVLHDRDRFCLAAPAAWVPLNVDGGLAATLNTTPGQAISLRPDWAASTEVCHLMVYVAAEASAADHLQARRAEFSTRGDLDALSPIAFNSLGGLLMPGFTWSANGGETGGIYADMLGVNRLLHISRGGTDCPLDALVPVLETLRVDPG